MPDSSMLSMPEIIQLTIWDRLNLATTNSFGADFLGLLTEVDESIEQLLPADRLSAAGEAIRRLGEIYAYRSAEQLSEIEYLFRPEQEPIMSLDAFDRYVRQSMVVDLEQFIEVPELPEYEREYNLTVVRERAGIQSDGCARAVKSRNLGVGWQVGGNRSRSSLSTSNWISAR
jgi:hypothetical protein